MLSTLTSLFLLVALQNATPQERAPQDSGDPGAFRIGVAVDQVFLSVTARSLEGGFVKDLKREEIKVFEDGVEQRIVNFTTEAVPVKVVLLIDASGSTRYSQASIRRAALHFARSLGPEDEVAIITFNYDPVLILDWTSDMERVELALESIYAKGATVMNDALYVAFDDLLKGVSGRKAVIMLTDGVDTASSMTFEEALDLAVRSEAMVYVASKLDEYWSQAIAIRSTNPGLFGKELSDDYIIDLRRSLRRMADMTGGRYLEAQAFSSLTDVYSAVAEELKNQYYISYVPSKVVKDGKWRSIDIRPFRPGVEVRTRPGYYAPLEIGS